MNYHFMSKLFFLRTSSICLSLSAFATTSAHRAAEDILYGTGDLSSQAITRVINRIESQNRRAHLPLRKYEESNAIINESRNFLKQKIESINIPDLQYLKPRVKRLIKFGYSNADLSIFSYLLQEVDAEMGPID